VHHQTVQRCVERALAYGADVTRRVCRKNERAADPRRVV
jgi:hypothetical protein